MKQTTPREGLSMTNSTTQAVQVSRRTLLALGTLGAAAACSPVSQSSGPKTDANPGGASLTFWKPPGQLPEGENKFFADLASAFGSQHHGDKVKHLLVPWNDAFTKFTAAFGGGTAPDVSYLILLWLNQFGSAGALTPLNEIDKNLDSSLSGYNVSALSSARGPNNELYGLPYYSSRWALALNEAVWEKAGKPALPKTYADLAEFVKKLTFDKSGHALGESGFDKGNIATYGLAWPGLQEIQLNYLWNYLWAYGADYVSEDGKSVGFDNPGGRQALTLMRQVQESGAATPMGLYADAQKWSDLVMGGRAAVQWVEPPKADSFKAHPNARLKVLDLPAGPKGTFVVGGVGYLCVSSKSKNPQAALDFIKFATSDENTTRYLQQALQFPVRNTTSEKVFATVADKRVKAFLDDSLPQGKFMRLTRPLPYNAEQYLVGEINNYVSGQKDLDQMIADATKQIQTMAKNAGK
jgi:ABC-type glycerol-3-phosphate transport system substrate-binding protein